MLIREALAQGGADLKYAGIKTPGLDASLLLSHILKKSRAQLLASSEETLSEETCEEYCALIERRCFGECAAYITGVKEFRGLEFKVNHSVLVPRPDTETLVEAALEILSAQPREQKTVKVLDLCTGSGAVAVALKHEMPELEIHACDISGSALETAKENAVRLLGENKIQFCRGDLFSALPHPETAACDSPLPDLYALIAANPPYIPSDEIQTLSAEVQNEPRAALDGGKTGLQIIGRIIDQAPDYLRGSGTLLLEADPRQMDEIKITLEKKGFTKIKTYNDLSSSRRVIGGVYEK